MSAVQFRPWAPSIAGGRPPPTPSSAASTPEPPREAEVNSTYLGRGGPAVPRPHLRGQRAGSLPALSAAQACRLSPRPLPARRIVRPLLAARPHPREARHHRLRGGPVWPPTLPRHSSPPEPPRAREVNSRALSMPTGPPVPRPSGARFCARRLLVAGGRPPRARTAARGGRRAPTRAFAGLRAAGVRGSGVRGRSGWRGRRRGRPHGSGAAPARGSSPGRRSAGSPTRRRRGSRGG